VAEERSVSDVFRDILRNLQEMAAYKTFRDKEDGCIKVVLKP
jgi:threonine dehydrogenase-like Zn-dependent dehydrogenase